MNLDEAVDLCQGLRDAVQELQDENERLKADLARHDKALDRLAKKMDERTGTCPNDLDNWFRPEDSCEKCESKSWECFKAWALEGGERDDG